MKDLIPVKQNKQGELLVSARNLHEGLEIDTKFIDWFKRMLKYGFEENEDYFKYEYQVQSQKRERTYIETDYILKIDCAKEIAMIQRNERGKQVRKYFIECECKLKENKPQLTKHDQAILNIINSRTDLEKALAIKDFEKVVTEPLQDEIKVLKPKAHYTDIILQNKGLIKVTSIAKDYGMSAQEFNKL